MRNLLRKLKKTKGAVTIEATLSLTTFLFMFMMIYSIITICRAQATIQTAINATAKELSQYSYLYSISGLHDAMKNVADGAEDTKENVNQVAKDVNEVATNVSDVFSGIQSITDKNVSFGDVGAITGQWEGLMDDLNKTEGSVTQAKESLTNLLDTGDSKEGSYKLIFGMAKLMVSEGYEQAKSAAAEAVSRVMVKKHLKRNDKDTAENFCRAMGIQPGTYLTKESYFNGIDFSHSRLLPYKSNEIIIVANYKIKLLQLLPVDITFHCTQTAVTMAWLQGDVEVPDTPKEVVNQRGGSVWNGDPRERERLIRSMGLTELKKDGFYSVSGNNNIHAYSEKSPGTLAVVRSYNPLEGLDSVGKVNIEDIKNRLTTISSQVESSTANIQAINIKKPDKNGNLKVTEKDCSKAVNRKVILVIPEDEGLKKKFEDALATIETDVEFEFLPGYGTVFEKENKEAAGG